MHAEHAPSSSNKGGGTATNGYKSAVAGPVFDFGNDDLLPSFEFQPAAEARKSTTTQHVDDRARRNLSPSPLVSYPVAFFFSSLETQVVATVERTMKKYADNLLHVLEGMSGRLSQLEFNSQRIEHTVGKLKVESADHHGAADGKLRSLENMVREVQRGVQVLRDKQEIVEEQLKLAKLQHDSKMEAHSQTQQQNVVLTPQQQAHQQLLPQHSQQLQVQAMPLTLQLEPHYQPQTLSQPLLSQPQQQAHQQLPTQHSQQLQLQAKPQTSLPEPQYQPQALPQPLQSQPQQLTHPIPQQQSDVPSYSPQPPGKYSSEKVPAYLPEGYGNRPFPQPLPQTQQHSPNLSSDQTYDLSGNNRGGQSALPPPYHPGHTTPPVYETYAPFGYRVPSPGTNPLVPNAGSYPLFPTAQPLTGNNISNSASNMGSSSGSPPSSTNRVTIDEVINKVASMGFSKDQVHTAIRKLTENGQSVDLNIVLDKLMNGGGDASELQSEKGWYNQ
ncbi:unnamed protein product [Sphagnum troendelagicum]|uniref:UBA domain-containing protein n=1 Tax=Sphagnum troendelagicum TaxID=128251 RepID=A0ABP0U969_9BRYO